MLLLVVFHMWSGVGVLLGWCWCVVGGGVFCLC